MADATMLVMGATGTVGSAVVRELAARGIDPIGATRDAARAARAGLPVSEWRALDLERPETFGAALEGVERVFLIARPGDDDPARAAAPLVEAMRGAGVVRVVVLTALGVEKRDDLTLRALERLVEEASFGWTHLRPNWFMQVLTGGPLLAGIRATGRLRLAAGDARVSYVDARDVGAVAAVALAEAGHEGAAYDLTGGEALHHEEVAARISAASGRAIEYVPVADDEVRRTVVGAGLGAERAERLVRFYRLVREGHASPVSDAVERVLRRPPTSFDDFAREHADVWRAPTPAGAATASPPPGRRPLSSGRSRR